MTFLDISKKFDSQNGCRGKRSHQSRSRFLVALLPPAEIEAYAAKVIRALKQRYGTDTATASPHITLYPPFLWSQQQIAELEAHLQDFARTQSKVPVYLSNFGAFAPRVIYLDVVKTPELLDLQAALAHSLEAQGIVVGLKRAYSPHLTVASRNVTQQIFQQAWTELQSQTFKSQFIADRLTLLIYTDDHWQIQAEFGLSNR